MKKIMNLNNILKISQLCVMKLTQNQKYHKLNIVVGSDCSNRLLCGIHCFTISICTSVYQFNDGAD